MALIYADRVKETWTGTGTTSPITLAGAATGFRTFTSALTTGVSVTYCIEDGTDWETGEGIFTTSGTTLSRATIIASSNAGAIVSFAAGTKNVFLTVSARDVHPQGLGELYGGTTGSLAATYNRLDTQGANTAGAATSGTLRLHGITLYKGLPVNNIAFWSGTTAGGTLTNQWFGVFDSARVVLAKTANDTSTAWAANAKKILAIAGGYVIPSTGFYYVGYVITATTVPTIECSNAFQNTGSRLEAPIADGNSTTGLTTPASCTGTQTALTIISQHAYVELS